MLTSLRIENFRSIKSMAASKLQTINLVTGRNSGGKTTFLEAVFLASGGANANLALMINSFRGDNFISPMSDNQFRSLFFDMDTRNAILISGESRQAQKSRPVRLLIDAITGTNNQRTGSVSETRTVGLRFSFKGKGPEVTSTLKWSEQLLNTLKPTPEMMKAPFDLILPPEPREFIYAQFISPYLREMMEEVHNQVAEATKSKRLQGIIDSVRFVEPGVENIVALNEFGRPTVYVDVGKPSLLPISSLGSGFFHVLKISLALSLVQDGIIIIDEIEDGLHYSVMPKISNLLINTVKEQDVQIFISTHSNEFIESFLATASELNFRKLSLINFASAAGSAAVPRQFDAEEIEVTQELQADLR